MATTTNYGWTTPDDTALVKDGASAIRTLGSSVDTTTKALNPSTTLGDVEYRSSTANTNTRLGIGTTGQVLTVSGGVPAWATPAGGGGMTLLASGSFAAAATGLDLSSISQDYKNLVIFAQNWSFTGTGRLLLRFNNDSTTIYSSISMVFDGTASVGGYGSVGHIQVVDNNSASENFFSGITIYDYADATHYKHADCVGSDMAARPRFTSGIWASTAAINRVQLIAQSGTFDRGTYQVYGVK
jgi:hypothetical protein